MHTSGCELGPLAAINGCDVVWCWLGVGSRPAAKTIVRYLGVCRLGTNRACVLPRRPPAAPRGTSRAKFEPGLSGIRGTGDSPCGLPRGFIYRATPRKTAVLYTNFLRGGASRGYGHRRGDASCPGLRNDGLTVIGPDCGPINDRAWHLSIVARSVVTVTTPYARQASARPLSDGAGRAGVR